MSDKFLDSMYNRIFRLSKTYDELIASGQTPAKSKDELKLYEYQKKTLEQEIEVFKKIKDEYMEFTYERIK